MRFALYLSAASCLLALAACSTTPRRAAITTDAAPAMAGSSDVYLIDAPADQRYVAQPGVVYEQPAPFPDNALPPYPPALLSRRLGPVDVRLRVVVNAQGLVVDTSLLAALPDDHAVFADSARTAVRQWRFFPLVQIEPGEPGTLTIGDVTTSYAGRPTALPFHHDYSLRFVQHDGKPAVLLDP